MFGIDMSERKRNYQKELERIIEENGKHAGNEHFDACLSALPRLLIHSCCAPCSSYVLEYLSEFFEITVLYSNSNITDQQEYFLRVNEQKRLIEEMNARYGKNMKFAEGKYCPEVFLQKVKGTEHCPEGGERCKICFAMRLEESACYAAEQGFDYFTTTLTISPLKNADVLNEIGEQMGAQYKVAFLPSDFKKKNGYKRSVELSGEYGLYRQNYCGCAFSKAEALKRQKEQNGKETEE